MMYSGRSWDNVEALIQLNAETRQVRLRKKISNQVSDRWRKATRLAFAHAMAQKLRTVVRKERKSL